MKRLIVCCDGTWNKLANPCPTNVIRIAQSVVPTAQDGTPQIVFYEEGLGTQWYDKLPGGAFGWGIDQSIQNAYRFLSLNYEPGDQIYLFGFSRGAYTVRSLAGMIYCSGLLTRHHICEAPKAYSLYRDRAIKPGSTEAEDFRQQYCKRGNDDRVSITLLGCWDTVGALGVPNLLAIIPLENLINAKYRFHDTELNCRIEHALHAIAIDERRAVFDVTPMQKSPKAPNQVVEQVWFPGVHGCVGGGTEAYRGLSDGALLWMMNEINHLGLGLEFDPTRIAGGISPDPTVVYHSDPGYYRLAGLIWRTIEGPFETIHESAKKRWCARSDYRPESLKPYEKDLTLFCQ